MAPHGRERQLSIDCRGKPIIKALLEVADSRFQDELLKEAKSAGKISKNYQIPDHARDNRPERLEKVLTR
jgi:acyl-CoA hydrolase